MVTTAGVPPSLSSLPRPATRRWIAGFIRSPSSSVSAHCHGHGQGQARLRPRTPSARPYHAAVWPSYGITTPVPDHHDWNVAKSPYRFETGYALCAKRPSRPFPPPFMSPPSSSFSDPLTTHSLSQDKRLSVQGELIRGLNNGDDAIVVAENFIGVDDGVGAWATRPHGHAA